jgi:hypothetical protein
VRPKLEELIQHAEHYELEEGESLEEQLFVIDSLVEMIDEMDPGGTIFRYAENVRAKPGKPRERTDAPPPFNVVNLGDWRGSSRAAFCAAQTLLHVASEMASDLARTRNDAPVHFHKTVMARAKRQSG